jgi:hypothetical protein
MCVAFNIREVFGVPWCADVVGGMMVHNPALRITLEQFSQHRWWHALKRPAVGAGIPAPHGALAAPARGISGVPAVAGGGSAAPAGGAL